MEKLYKYFREHQDLIPEFKDLLERMYKVVSIEEIRITTNKDDNGFRQPFIKCYNNKTKMNECYDDLIRILKNAPIQNYQTFKLSPKINMFSGRTIEEIKLVVGTLDLYYKLSGTHFKEDIHYSNTIKLLLEILDKCISTKQDN
jgi:L-rhamnose mutarotase